MAPEAPSTSALPPSIAKGAAKWLSVLVVGGALLAGAWALRISLLGGADAGTTGPRSGPIPVEVATVEHGTIERRRELSGTLEAGAEFVVSAKVGGRLERVAVDLADVVQRGQVVAWLDDDEFRQAEAQAAANLAVARAQQQAAAKQLKIAGRSYERVAGLQGRQVLSEQDLDTAQSAKLAAEATLAVATAEASRARAALKAAQLRKGYARVTADWPEGDAARVVGERFADEGATVSANEPLLSIVDLDPVVVVVYVTERDYAELAKGQAVRLTTDAFGDEVFEGSIDRIAPVFRAQSRQARVELRVPNPKGRLKPGMFVRAATTIERLENATIVPRDAVVTRDGDSVVFVLASDRRTVTKCPVKVGIEQGERVAVTGACVRGAVVTLGQQELTDGAAVAVASAGMAVGPEAS